MTYSTSKCKSPTSYALSKNFSFDPAVKPFSRGVFLAICGLATNESRTAFPTQQFLADYFGVSTRYIREALKDLLDYGYIIQVARKRKLVAVYAISMSGKYKDRDDKLIELKSHSKTRKKTPKKTNNQEPGFLVTVQTTRNYSSNNQEPGFLEKIKEEESPFSKGLSIPVSPCEQSSPVQPSKNRLLTLALSDYLEQRNLKSIDPKVYAYMRDHVDEALEVLARAREKVAQITLCQNPAGLVMG